MKKRSFGILKLLFLALAIYLLADKLLKVAYWQELSMAFRDFSVQRLVLLLMIFALMPLNWVLETKKWQILVKKANPLTFSIALKSVLSGIGTGFVTPNRIGEFAGRVLLLDKQNRTVGVLLNVINGITQNAVITVLGLCSSLFYFSRYQLNEDFRGFLWIVVFVLIAALVFLLFLPRVFSFLQKKKLSEKIHRVLAQMSDFTWRELSSVLFVSAFRFGVFCTQYFFMLRFFGIELTALEGFISIPVMYLLVTYTPSFSVSEPAVRSAYAVFVFSVFTSNQIGVILSSLLLWVVNFLIPLFVGLWLMAKVKSERL